MNVVRRDFKELKNEVPVLLVHKCCQCVQEHSLPQPESNLKAPVKSSDPRASSAKTRGFHTQLDEGPETP